MCWPGGKVVESSVRSRQGKSFEPRLLLVLFLPISPPSLEQLVFQAEVSLTVNSAFVQISETNPASKQELLEVLRKGGYTAELAGQIAGKGNKQTRIHRAAVPVYCFPVFKTCMTAAEY